MSLRSMMTKLAIAYVAAKGAKAFSQGGGMEGLKRRLSEQQKSGQGLGGMLSGSGGGGGLGDILGQLGLGNPTQTGNPTAASSSSASGGVGGRFGGASGAGGLGGLLGGIAGASEGERGSARMRGLLEGTQPPPLPEEAEAGLVIRAMIMAAKADGEIDDQERRALWEVFGDSDSSEDRGFVDQALAAPVDVDALAADVPPGMELEIYTASVLAIEPDNRAEAEYLDKLARRMGLDQATVNEVHVAQGKTPLYST